MRQGGLGATALLSLIGLVLGVASLVVAMAVVSGYQSTLKRTVIDVVGHMLVMKRGTSLTPEDFDKDIAPLVPELQAKTPFLYLEALVAHKNMISGIIVEGMDLASVHDVLNLKSRLLSGSFEAPPSETEAPAWIGKGLAQKYDLKVGDSFRIVLPVNSDFDASTFRPKLGHFRVHGVLNLGRQDYDSRYVMTDLQNAQALANVGQKISGFRLRLQSSSQSEAAINRISNQFGYQYVLRDWEEVNHNLFEAAKLEKIVIFLVLMVLMIAAAFNVSSTLFVGVMKRYHDISLIRTLGATRQSVRRLFLMQGLSLGAVGSILGLLVGFAICGAFMWGQAQFGLIPAEVYKLDRIDVEFRWTDLLAIVGVCLAICFVFSWAPARRGAQLSPIEGLRYE